MMVPRLHVAALALAAATASCADETSDAFGNFEANEVSVSAEFPGRLVSLDVAEGQRVAESEVVAELDTVQLALQRNGLQTHRESARLRTAEARAQVRVLEAQLATAQDDLARTERLYGAEAATAQDLNRVSGSVNVLMEQVGAARARVRVANQEGELIDAQLAELNDRMGRARIKNPTAGTVLTRFAEAGEFVQPGQPLYTIAPLDTLTFRAYVSGAQLASVRVGSQVQVLADVDAGSVAAFDGRVTWVASEAEFTPTPIQTRDERVDQVYAVKVLVANPGGVLKVGMPGELVLSRANGSQP